MKQVITYIFLAVFLVNCNQFSKPEKPENLISETDMVAILVDLSLLSSAKGINKTTLQNNGISPEEYIYKTHKIDSAQFLKSNQYYSYSTNKYEVILSRVEDSLKQLKEKYNTKIRKEDSLSKPTAEPPKFKSTGKNPKAKNRKKGN